MIGVILLVLALLIAAGGVAVLLQAAARRHSVSGETVDPGTLVADAQAQASTLVADTRTAALRARESNLDELNARRAAVESREAVITEPDRTLRERREVFDERRFAFKKRREEIDARREAVDAERAEIAATVARVADLDHESAVRVVLERLDAELQAEHQERVAAAVAERTGEEIDATASNVI